MKHSELKEIIREEVRKALNESEQDYEDAMQNLAKMADINLSKPQGLNKFRTEPSFEYPIILPAANGSAGVSTVIRNKDNFENWKTEFNQYFPGEKPMFKKSTFYDNGWDVTNPTFVASQERSNKNVSGYMAQYGTKGD